MGRRKDLVDRATQRPPCFQIVEPLAEDAMRIAVTRDDFRRPTDEKRAAALFQPLFDLRLLPPVLGAGASGLAFGSQAMQAVEDIVRRHVNRDRANLPSFSDQPFDADNVGLPRKLRMFSTEIGI